MRLLLILGALMVLVAACSNDGSEEDKGRILALPGADVPESDYRALVRSLVGKMDVEVFCQSIRDSSDAEIVDNLISPQEPEGTQEPTVGPDQDADPEDVLFAATIIREECDRLLGGGASPTPVSTPTATASGG